MAYNIDGYTIEDAIECIRCGKQIKQWDQLICNACETDMYLRKLTASAELTIR